MFWNVVGLLGWFGGGWWQGFLWYVWVGVDDDEGVGVQVFGYGGFDLFDVEFFDLFEEVFQVVQWQVVEIDGVELVDDVGVVCGGQWEVVGQFVFGVVQFFLGWVVGQVVVDDVLDQFQCFFVEFGVGLEVDYEWIVCLYGGEVGIDVVGQVVFFLYLVYQVGVEVVVVEDLVVQVECCVVGILVVDVKLGEYQVGLFGGEVDVCQVGFGCFWLDGFGQCWVLGQCFGDFCGDCFGFLL